MRGVRLLLPMLVALAVGGCLRQQQTMYVIDSNTGQPVPVMTQQQLTQPQSAQQTFEPRQQAAPSSDQNGARGLFSWSPAYVQQSYAQVPYPPEPIAQPQPAPSTRRGLFNNMRRSYIPRAYAPQVYAPQVYAQPQSQPPSVVQYIPPGQSAQSPSTAQQSDAMQPQYVAPQPAPQPAPQYMRQRGSYAAAPYAYAPANLQQPAYTLDSGDKLRVVVFGQDGLTNSYTVDAGGNVNLPLIGAVPVRGYGTQQLSQMIAERLKQGYVREPHVSVEIDAYRPFFILGEVTNPGQYPYVANMTAETAIAIAGGFAPRANKGKVEVTRNSPGQQMHGDVSLGFPLRPGDTILVKERWF